MMHRSLFVFLSAMMVLTLAASPGLGVGPYYEEYFTDGTTDIEWRSAFRDSLGNPLTPMQVDFVTGNPSGDGWVGLIEADTAVVGGLGLALAGDPDLNDYSMEAEVWVDVTSSSYYEGIMMRVNEDPGTGVVTGYQLVSNFYPPFFIKQLKFRKYSTIPDDIVDLRVFSSTEIPGGAPTVSGWHTFKIKAVGDQFWLYWDDQELPDNPQTDTTATPFSSGEFGIYTFNIGVFSQVLSDDIIVSPAGMTLENPSPGLVGQNNTLSVSGATPGANVYFLFGFAPGSTNVPGCPGSTFDIANLSRNNLIGVDQADVNGDASVTVFVPNQASGRRILFQAAELSNCIISNRVDYTFP